MLGSFDVGSLFGLAGWLLSTRCPSVCGCGLCIAVFVVGLGVGSFSGVVAHGDGGGWRIESSWRWRIFSVWQGGLGAGRQAAVVAVVVVGAGTGVGV